LKSIPIKNKLPDNEKGKIIFIENDGKDRFAVFFDDLCLCKFAHLFFNLFNTSNFSRSRKNNPSFANTQALIVAI
jgi:hypothetical protein